MQSTEHEITLLIVSQTEIWPLLLIFLKYFLCGLNAGLAYAADDRNNNDIIIGIIILVL